MEGKGEAMTERGEIAELRDRVLRLEATLAPDDLQRIGERMMRLETALDELHSRLADVDQLVAEIRSLRHERDRLQREADDLITEGLATHALVMGPTDDPPARRRRRK